MIRRIVLAAAAAVALILAPTVAMAYNAPGYGCFVTDSTPASGHPIKVHCSHGHTNEKVTLTTTSNPASISSNAIQIAGTKSLTKTSNASGAVDFTATLTGAGTYALAVTNASGAVLSSQTVTVAAAGAAAPAATGQLSRTGFDPTGLLVGGGLLLLAGTGAVLAAKRRKSSQVAA